MGSIIEFDATGEPIEITYMVIGTDDLASIEILKWNFNNPNYATTGRPLYETVLNPDFTGFSTTTSEGILRDTFHTDSSLYYLRVKQVNEIEGEEIWGWTSPIWLIGPNLITGVENKISSMQHFKLYPNISVDGIVNTKLYLSAAVDLKMNIVDLTERILKERDINAKSNFIRTRFDVQDLPSGQYFIQIQSMDPSKKNATMSKPFIVQKKIGLLKKGAI